MQNFPRGIDYESNLDQNIQEEKMPESLEEKTEKQIKEVCREFEKLTDKEYKEVCRLMDDKGLYLYEVEIAGNPAKNENKKTTLYYLREGNRAKNSTSEAEISIVYYEKSGNGKWEAVYMDQKAKLINGEWLNV